MDFVPLLDCMGVPYIVQGHGIDLSASLRKPGLARRYAAYKSARAILTRCEFHRRRLIALGLPADKIHVNPGGIDIPAATPQRTEHAAKRFQASPSTTLATDHCPAVQQFVDASRLGARVRLHGAAAEETKHRLLHECGVFVQHSITDPETGDEEGLPAAIQEAMAHGMAIISTRHAGIAEAVDDGATGRLVKEGDCAGMAQAMLQTSSQPLCVLRLGAAARVKAERLYSWSAERARVLQHLGAMA